MQLQNKYPVTHYNPKSILKDRKQQQSFLERQVQRRNREKAAAENTRVILTKNQAYLPGMETKINARQLPGYRKVLESLLR